MYILISFQLAGYDVRDVKGDGGCYYRCLSAYFTGAEDSYNKYRREVVAYIRDHLGKYLLMQIILIRKKNNLMIYF